MCSASHHGVRGLIPAWAGKTSPGQRRAWPEPAHPRVGGENVIGTLIPGVQSGSSPRGRGKLDATGPALTGTGLIPAWAGKTPLPSAGLTGPWAHPRVGGENRRFRRSYVMGFGSSPRGRGKRDSAPPVGDRRRLIPAWAGKTCLRRQKSSCRRAHPRVGGENDDRYIPLIKARGSSPRGRGKHPRSRRR